MTPSPTSQPSPSAIRASTPAQRAPDRAGAALAVVRVAERHQRLASSRSARGSRGRSAPRRPGTPPRAAAPSPDTKSRDGSAEASRHLGRRISRRRTYIGGHAEEQRRPELLEERLRLVALEALHEPHAGSRSRATSRRRCRGRGRGRAAARPGSGPRPVMRQAWTSIARVRREVGVGEHRALRPPGGPGGVDDRRRDVASSATFRPGRGASASAVSAATSQTEAAAGVESGELAAVTRAVGSASAQDVRRLPGRGTGRSRGRSARRASGRPGRGRGTPARSAAAPRGGCPRADRAPRARAPSGRSARRSRRTSASGPDRRPARGLARVPARPASDASKSASSGLFTRQE